MAELKKPASLLTGLLYLGFVVALVVFAPTMGGAALGAIVSLVVLTLVAYAAYVVGGRVNDRLRHGKPLLRRGGEP